MWVWFGRQTRQRGYDPGYVVGELLLLLICRAFLALGIYLTLNRGSGH